MDCRVLSSASTVQQALERAKSCGDATSEPASPVAKLPEAHGNVRGLFYRAVFSALGRRFAYVDATERRKLDTVLRAAVEQLKVRACPCLLLSLRSAKLPAENVTGSYDCRALAARESTPTRSQPRVALQTSCCCSSKVLPFASKAPCCPSSLICLRGTMPVS